MHNCDVGVVYILDLTEETSFERAKFWIDELKANEEVN